ncbi:MAG: hypothetical protein RL136_2366, partial [Planctomycetota bacterium]
MKKAHHFASNLVPLLARILLFLAFVPAGWHHAMDWTQFQGGDAERLQQLGVQTTLSGPNGQALVHYGQADIDPTDGRYADTVHARSLHELTLALDDRGVPRAHVAAWVIAVVELIGGGMLLVGLFSRVWAAGIAFWSVALFGLTTWHAVDWGSVWSATIASRASAFGLMTIGVLSLGLAFGGAGAFSLDALIFRRGEAA